MSGVGLFYLHYTTALPLAADLLVLGRFYVCWRRHATRLGTTPFQATASQSTLSEAISSRSFPWYALILVVACLAEWTHVNEVAARRGNWLPGLERHCVTPMKDCARMARTSNNLFH